MSLGNGIVFDCTAWDPTIGQKHGPTPMSEVKRRTMSKSRLWARARAALIAYHVAAIVMLSFPGSAKLGDKQRWKERRTQAQLALWGKRLRGWGIDIDDAAFEQKLWGAAQIYLRTRALLTTPFAPYAHVAPQGWGMFKAPPLDPSQMAVDVQAEGGAFRTVHLTGSSEHAYLSETLGNNRFRKQIGRTGRDPRLFANIAKWLARQTFRDFPDAVRVRVRVVRLHSLPPDRRAAGEATPSRTERQHIFTRDQLE